jgi:hypothetical protein
VCQPRGRSRSPRAGDEALSPERGRRDPPAEPVEDKQAGIAVNLRVEGNPSKLAPGVDLAAYRIVQEALTNTVRHSGAPRRRLQ